MSKELIVHSSQHETRLAILEDDQLVELHIENESQHALAGSIYKGRVTRVLPGMQSAFVNIGLERDAFLYVSDFFDESDEKFDQVAVAPAGEGEGKPEELPESEAAETNGSAPPESPAARESSAGTEESRPASRDRRGRRSGRRRGRGAGFPTTKYAAVEAAEETAKAEQPAVQDSAAESEFVVLPGESLAKYSDAAADPVPDAGVDTDLPSPEREGGVSRFDAPHPTAATLPPLVAARPRERAASRDEPLQSETQSKAESLESGPDQVASAIAGNGEETQEDELGRLGEPSEDDLAAGPVAERDVVEPEESPPSAGHDPDSQPAEESTAAGAWGREPEVADHAGDIPEETAAVEASPGVGEPPAVDEPDDVPPEAGPEPQASQRPVEDTAVESPAAAAVETTDALPQEDDDSESQVLESPARSEPLESASSSAPVEPPEELDASPQAIESNSDHPFPGYPGTKTEAGGEGEASGTTGGGETGVSVPSDDSQPREDAAEAEDSAGDNASQREARVRGRSGSSRYVHRRGRRGRRRPQRQSEQPERESSTDAAAATESDTSDGDTGRKITDLLAKGQQILVQIAKEPLGRKGARITSHIALPGRFLVYMPTVDHIGVSRKIPSDNERVRLRKIVQAHRTGMPGGFIVRTAGEGVSEEEVRGDMLFLYNQWLDIRDRSESSPAPALLHHDDDVVERVLRDRVGDDFKTIWVDGEEEYERILRFVERFQPDLLKGVKLYTRGKPMFDQFNITAELAKALRPKVWLKSGGYIVINQTEALVAIDVNTGKYVGKSDRLEDTIVNTNLEAVKEIVRQLRIRDLGGIIVVDFIDMEDRSNRQQVFAALEKDLRADMAPSKVLPFNEFGLVAITRKRVKQSLERALCTPCPYCHGSATVKSVQTVIQEILSEARKMATSKKPTKDITLRVNQEIARKLKSRDNNYLQEIEQILRGHVLVRSDVSLHREHFDIG